MSKSCRACGMPLIEKEDFAGGKEDALFCRHCVNADGSVKSGEEIFEGGVRFFISQLGDDRKLAERITQKNMAGLPYWQGKNCRVLQGEMATDEEFAEVLKKLGA
ncbi:MAG TPA: zinc ribbon domain-containing protein [bacterium]|nr:zinc ribbon domain-containing protein [bacterium]HNS48134.1 zinc ribbon domain-containing protein [bacterium]